MTGFGKGGKGNIVYLNVDFDPGTIAVKTLVKGNAWAPSEDFRLLKMEGYLSMYALTDGEEDATILVGLACAELSATEIQEAIEAEPIDSNDNVALERSHRPVWPLGFLKPVSDDQVRYLEFEWSKRWTFSDTDGLCLWFYNMSASQALTTGSKTALLAKLYGVWVK